MTLSGFPIQRDDEPTAPVVTASSLLPPGGTDQDRARARLLAGALAPGVGDYKVVVIPGSPHAKERPRAGEGRVHKSARDKDAEARTGWLLRPAFRKPWAGNLAIGAVFFRPTRQHVDTDNLLKHVCDAGNGIAWFDDAQITGQYGVLELDAVHPRTLLVVTRHVSSMDRSDIVKARPVRRSR
ncbi:RusA family crossover junction endodeoxyribonuclease [Streptomyces cinereoruber]|uniref:RusA family crossover junction endodeoxyribonuclease n=1 Tax=Streptomyces cinereoruber TaxID=67260 RepID=UPI003636DED9